MDAIRHIHFWLQLNSSHLRDISVVGFMKGPRLQSKISFITTLLVLYIFISSVFSNTFCDPCANQNNMHTKNSKNHDAKLHLGTRIWLWDSTQTLYVHTFIMRLSQAETHHLRYVMNMYLCSIVVAIAFFYFWGSGIAIARTPTRNKNED
jgi:hypothetical protein